jgi:hypothetical protein
MSNRANIYRSRPDDSSLDISELATTRLTPREPQVKSYAEQVAQYEAEIQRLAELAGAVEQV